ncbi:MAG: choice-of-anchor Q domain-containing protein [Bacteroidales bacterium]
MFIDTSMLNYLPACNSDCINGGTIDTTGLNLPIYDIRKLQRISGDTIDIGAYEFCGFNHTRTINRYCSLCGK